MSLQLSTSILIASHYPSAVVIGLSVHKNQGRQCSPCCLPGYLRLLGCNTCCKRWFITFNGAECTGPLPIDAVVWNAKSDQDIHRLGFIKDYCNNIHKGRIRVGINIGNCAGYGNPKGQTGWNSVSRLVIKKFLGPSNKSVKLKNAAV